MAIKQQRQSIALTLTNMELAHKYYMLAVQKMEQIDNVAAHNHNLTELILMADDIILNLEKMKLNLAVERAARNR